ncbi:DUF4215 domain-containing protein [Candidatus Peregrinibacteria bacterium]|nr:DUF4215 domain-containing protein [Candidatus Peregrinibacteria bacterium]
MSSKQSFTQKCALWVATTAMVFTAAAPSVHAARMYFQDNPNLRKGCPGEINVMLDTEGQPISVADAVISYDSSRLTVNAINNASAFQAIARAVIEATSLDFRAMSFVGPFFNGTGAFATLDVDVPLTASSATLTFDKDYGITSLAAYEGTNYLNNATDKTFTFKNRYNADIDGGFCDPDTTPPQVRLILPGNGSGGNDVDTNIVFSLQDNRAGVDIDTLSYKIGGVSYTENSSQTSYNESGGIYSVTTNPDSDFSEGQKVNVEVYICDQNTDPSANCRTWRGHFYTYTPPPPDPVCGDGIQTYSIGEQCDDGNTIDGDGCSSLCLFETEVEECPPCPECPECVCEPEEVEMREAAEEEDSDLISEEIKTSIPGCTRKEVVLEVLNKFDVQERYSAYDAQCKDDIEHCMLPFLIHSSYDKADPAQDRYYPDVYLKGERKEPLLEDDAGPVSKKYKDAIHLATRLGMIHGFYEDTLNLSPFRPEWNMTRIQIVKVLNWAVLGQQWEYEEEYIAKIGGEENLQNVKALASDLTAWWYPRYYNRACEAGIFACDPGRSFGPDELCDPTWKRNIMAKYQVFYKQQGDEGFDDADNDTIVDRDEQYVFYTDPQIKDTDADSLDDGDEVTLYNTNPLVVDTDKDGLDDGEEITTHKTDPIKPDTDGDDVPDGVEIELGTDPLNKMSFPADANGNGIDDEWEIKYGISPQNGSDDTDGDGLSDLLEYRKGTNPLDPDTDADGISDADEVLVYGSNPLVITRESDLGMIITNISDGMTLTDARPLIQGYAPQKDMNVEVYLRNEFGHEVSLGKTTSDAGNAWVLTPEYDLLDGEFFLLAKGLDPANKQVLSSPLIKVTLDSSLQVDEPQPERLSDKTITEEVLLEGLRVDISDSKPMLIGKTGYKNRVVATWQSVVGTSAIVADLAGGEFRIEAPKELPFGEHSVSVYAIRESDQAISKVITLHFTVKEPVTSVLRGVAFGKEMGFPNYVWFIIIIGGGGLIGFGIWYDRKKHGKKK